MDAAASEAATPALVDVSELRNPEDPWEKFNRKVFWFNDRFDRYLLLPVATAYRFVLPEPVDQGISNFFTNLLMPITLFNDLFQLKFRSFGSDLGRFIVNSTVGVVGFIDVASRVGLEEEREDFGQTLGYWGVPPGPYVVIPFFTGRTVRDAFGMIPDWALSVQRHIPDPAVRYSVWALEFVDIRADLIPAEQLITGDRYIFLRDAYLQQRRYLIADGDIADDFGEEIFDGGSGGQPVPAGEPDFDGALDPDEPDFDGALDPDEPDFDGALDPYEPDFGDDPR